MVRVSVLYSRLLACSDVGKKEDPGLLIHVFDGDSDQAVGSLRCTTLAQLLAQAPAAVQLEPPTLVVLRGARQVLLEAPLRASRGCEPEPTGPGRRRQRQRVRVAGLCFSSLLLLLLTIGWGHSRPKSRRLYSLPPSE